MKLRAQDAGSRHVGSSFQTRCIGYWRFILVLGLFAAALPQALIYLRAAEDVSAKGTCTIESEERQIFASYLNQGSASPQIVLSITDITPTDLESLNVRVTANRRHLPFDLGTDFKSRNKAACLIKPLLDISNVHFISRQEYDSIVRAGWHEFRRKYGKLAEIVWLSRVGFNTDKTMALLHVSYGTEKNIGGRGALYVFERRKSGWMLRSYIQTWADIEARAGK